MSGKGKVEVLDVWKEYPKADGSTITSLQNVSLSVEQGQFASVIGPSGCGKSTLFHIIAGLLQPTSGDVTVDGESVVGRAGYVGYMLQKDMLLPWRTIAQNIILGLEVRGVPRKKALARAKPLIHKYGLGGFENQYPQELSGGMRQRAALLRTLLYDREIILLDEPFGALDAQTRLSMQSWLLQIWQDFGKTVLFVTHDIDEAIYLSDVIYVFTARPGTIRKKVTVPIARPRSPEDMISPQFMELKHELLHLLYNAGPADAGSRQGEVEP